MNSNWFKYALLVLLLLTLGGAGTVLYFFTGTKDNLDDLQKNLGIAVGVLFVIYIMIYGLLYVWLQAESDIFVPLVMLLCFINSLVATTGLTASILVKQ